MYCIKGRGLIIVVLSLVLTFILLSGCRSAGTKAEEKAGDVAAQTGAVEAGTMESSKPAAEAGTAAVPGIIQEEYQPNPEYDRYAMVEYMIEDIGAEFTATVSKKADDSEYEVHCMVENAEQVVVLDKDLAIVSDKTGNLGYDAPLIVQKAVDEDKWEDISR